MVKARMFLVLRYTPTYANIAFFFFPHMLKGMSQEKVWKFPLSLVGVFFFFFFFPFFGSLRNPQSRNILGLWKRRCENFLYPWFGGGGGGGGGGGFFYLFL
jgi:hypothetical protein